MELETDKANASPTHCRKRLVAAQIDFLHTHLKKKLMLLLQLVLSLRHFETVTTKGVLKKITSCSLSLTLTIKDFTH